MTTIEQDIIIQGLLRDYPKAMQRFADYIEKKYLLTTRINRRINQISYEILSLNNMEYEDGMPDIGKHHISQLVKTLLSVKVEYEDLLDSI